MSYPLEFSPPLSEGGYGSYRVILFDGFKQLFERLQIGIGFIDRLFNGCQSGIEAVDGIPYIVEICFAPVQCQKCDAGDNCTCYRPESRRKLFHTQ